ncbi:MAG: hypothetical protein IMF10_05645 [Proteobacteria bacterium]|nr:hypothetical protein [Pseudomonadota bacterium]
MAVVTLIPGIASARGLGEKTIMSMIRRLWNNVFQPSLIPDTDYWYLFLGAMFCIWALFAFFPKRFGEKELKIDIGLAHVGRVAVVLFMIGLFFMLIWFAYGLIKGFLIDAIISILPSWIPDIIIEAATWVLSGVISIFLVLGLFAMMRSIVEVSKGAFGGIKGLWAKFEPNDKNKKFLGIFGMMLIHSMLARLAYHQEIIWPIIAVSSLGVVVTIYHFGFENIRARVLHEPREPDGASRCINYEMVDEKRNGVPTGRKIKKTCEGPRGKDASGNPYRGWNPKNARFCMSPYCDYPNPVWQVCDTKGCPLAKSKEPFRRKPFEPVVCPGGCNTTYPALPKSTGFHSAEEDSYHIGMDGVPSAPATQPAPGTTQVPGTAPDAEALGLPNTTYFTVERLEMFQKRLTCIKRPV